MIKFVIIIVFLFFGCEKEEIQIPKIPQVKENNAIVKDTISKPIKKIKKKRKKNLTIKNNFNKLETIH